MPAVVPEPTVDIDNAQLLEEECVSPQPVRSTRPRTVALLAAAALAAVAITQSHKLRSAKASSATMLAEEAPAKDAPACVAPGQNCLEAQCCIDGGKKGYRCYEKNVNWGECFDEGNCTPGVHEPEKEGEWDANGVFQKAKWSCKEQGEVSKPACWSYDKKKICPADRCSWITGKCMSKCSTLFGEDSCWSSGNCMWESGKCQDGCWEEQGKGNCEKLSRCQWLDGDKPNTSSCGLACHVHGGEADCPPKDKCMWDGSKCVHDPCSAPGEDCRETKCCSVSRGGLGMKCVEKMKYWATCMDEFNKTAMPDWSGNILGRRAFEKGQPGEPPNYKFESGCSWAGEDCSKTNLCCNEGYTCNKKDDTFAGCVQAMQVSTWSKEAIPLPEGWEGTHLGDWRGEYAVEPTPEGKDMSGTSMYCIMAVLPDSPEMELLWTAQRNNASIFQCEGHSVYRAWQTDSAGWDTAEATVVNTAVFLKVMDLVKEDGLYLNYDWTVKVDADCVFLPERLRNHMWGLKPPPDTAVYLKNNNLEGLGNSGFLGAIEVFSKKAMMIFMDNGKKCGQFLGTNSGEDGFFKGCMDAIGVGFLWDQTMFKPNYDTATCTNGMYAAYHPIKYPSHWQRCWDIATGKMCQGLTYDCGGDLDPPVSSLR